MSIFNRATLQKLKILAYEDSQRQKKLGEFEVMYNPTTFSQKYEAVYSKKQAQGSSDNEKKFTHNKPTDLKLKLILDGTGVHQSSLATAPDPVEKQVSDFLNLVYYVNGDIHQPSYLKVQWGTLKPWRADLFSCRLSSVNITYTAFNPDSSPLRAELDVTFVSDTDIQKRKAQDGLNSPDLTHRRVVKSGDTLPLLCKEIYGDASHYLKVADDNDLNNFRFLQPGQELFFRPLEK